MWPKDWDMELMSEQLYNKLHGFKKRKEKRKLFLSVLDKVTKEINEPKIKRRGL